jgi:hypothetical protein
MSSTKLDPLDQMVADYSLVTTGKRVSPTKRDLS